MNEIKEDPAEKKEASPLKLHRRTALKRIAALGGVSTAVIVAAKCTSPYYSAYTKYCDGVGRNYHHYGDTYCNYYDYNDYI
jgi:hypothetical protein